MVGTSGATALQPCHRYAERRACTRWRVRGSDPESASEVKKYGFAGLSETLYPGVRAIVPPFAGAMKLPAFGVILSIASASLVWFGLITFLAFRAGNNWDLLQRYLVQSGKVAGGIAVGIVVLAVLFWVWKRRARRNE